jgi:hypothetical protein
MKRKPKERCPVKYCRRDRGKKKAMCDRHHHARWRAKNPMRAAWLNLRHHAKQRRREFDLSFEDFKAFVEENNYYLDHKGCLRHLYHIDRIDPRKGYTRENIQLLTCSENSAKGNRERYRKEPDPFLP